MEYTQLTINDWLAMKNELEEELRGAAAGFVRIGYLLRKIEEQKGYERDGYKSLAEWAKDTYGLSESSVSRFIAINRKYSIDGYSKQLRFEFAKFGQAKLAEMLTLSDEGLEMVSPEMKREDIRELKRFEREAPKESPVLEETDCPAWILHFVEKEDFTIADFEGKPLEKMIEEINPYGTRMYRDGATMVSMLRDRLTMRTFPNPPERMEWQQFFEMFLPALRRKVPEKPAEMPKEEAEVPAEEQKVSKEPEKVTAEREKAEQKQAKAERKQEKASAKVPEPAAVDEGKPAAVEEPLAPAQENPPAIVESNENQDSPIEETEVEQVEIDEILPKPTDDPYEELKDRFREVMNSINVMLDANNFESLGVPLARLDTLKDKLIAKKEELS